MPVPLPNEPEAGNWPVWITDSHLARLGSRLADAAELYDIDAVVLCHDTATDPRFVYANRAAQRLWERSWDDFIGWPSRMTAPASERRERAQALAGDAVLRGYSGIRVTTSGRLFRVWDAIVWPVTDGDGRAIGQAATFRRWRFLDRDG